MLCFGHPSLSCLFEEKCSFIADLFDVVNNMLRAWDFFKGQIPQTDYTLEDFQIADIWADPQVTINGIPLGLTSIVSKQLLHLRLVWHGRSLG